MRFYGAADAYGWYRSRRFALEHPGALPRQLFDHRAISETAVTLVDLERLLGRLERSARKALRERNADYPAAARRFETLLRESSYLH